VTKQVQVQDRNDTPTLNLPGAGPTIFEDLTATLSGITVGDVDIGTGKLHLVVSVGRANTGILTYTPSGSETVTGSGSTAVTIVGTIAQLNAAFAAGGLKFIPNANYNTDGDAAVPVNFALDDQGSTGTLTETNPITGLPAQPVQKAVAVTVTGVNDPPVVTPDPLAVGPLNYAVNSAPILIAPNATVVDVDYPKSPDLNGGILTVQVAGANPPANNALRIQNQGFGAGQIGLQGQSPNISIIYTPDLGGGVAGTSVIVGQITSSGTGTLPLKVLFNSSAATPAVVQAVVRSITFQTTGTSFDATPRTINFDLTDGDGLSQVVAASVVGYNPQTVLYSAFDTQRVINVAQINNPPSFTLPGTAPAVAEDAGPQTVTGFATNLSPGPAPYEATQNLTFIVTGNTNPGLFSAAPTLTWQTAAGDPTLADLAYTPAANAFGTATITVKLMDDGGTLVPGSSDTSATQTFTITVTPVADTPSVTPASPGTSEDTPTGTITVNRNQVDGPEVAYFQVTNIHGGVLALAGGGTVTEGEFLTYAQANGIGLVFTPAGDANDSNTPGGFGFSVQASLTGVASGLGGGVVPVTISVSPVDDAPVLTGVSATTPYLVSQPAVAIAPMATVTDIDSPDFDSGVLTVAYAGGSAQANDTLAVQDSATDQVSVSLGVVSVGGNPIGTVSGGANGADLTVTFSGPNATPAAVQAVLRNVVFSTPTGNGGRDLAITVTDGDGGTSNTGMATVAVKDTVAVLGLTATDPTPTRALTAVHWLLTTDLPEGGFTGADFVLTGSLFGSATLAPTVTATSATTFVVTATLDPAAGSGTLGLQFVSAAGLTVGVSNTLPVDGDVYTVDRTGPAVTGFANGDADGRVPVNQPVTYTVTFSEPLDAASVQGTDFVNVGTAPVTISVTAVSGNTVTLSVTPTGAGFPSGLGTLTLQVPASATITDVLGNPLVGTYTDPRTLDVDAVPPAVTGITNSTSSTPANVTAPNAAVTYTVTFSEAVDQATVSAADFVNVGSAPAATGTVTQVSPTQYTVVVTPTAVGTLQLKVGPNLTDVAGNPMAAAVADVYAATEDTPFTADAAHGVRANDTDPNDATAALSVDTTPVSAPTKGLLVLAADGSFTYTPFQDANGTDTFTYRVNDPHGGSAVGTVTIHIAAVNDPPTFTTAPLVTVLEDSGPYSSATPLVTNITAGGSGLFVENDALVGFTTTVVSADATMGFSASPAVTLVGNTGRLTFTPAPNAYGTATIRVTLTDAGSNVLPNRNATSETFTITVTPVNDAPSFALSGNPPVSAQNAGVQSVPGFSSFDPGPNEAGQTATYTLSVTGSTGGLTFASPPTIDANGTLTYQATPGTSGTATVQVGVKDSGGTANGGVDTASFTQSFVIVVRPVAALPTAAPDAGLVPKDAGPTFIDVLSNDSPAANGNRMLTVVSVTQPAHGTAAVAPNGRGVLYTPAAGFTGTDTFGYTLNDGNGGPASSTVTVTVRPVPAGQPLFDVVAVGSGPGGGPVVRVNSLSTGSFTATFAAYDPSFRGGVNVAIGDVNGDGVPDVITTPGFGGGPQVKIIDGTKLGLLGPDGQISDAAVLASFFAYDPSFRGGVTVTVADVNGDGKADIITGTGPGGGAAVKVISGASIGLPTLGDGEVNPAAMLASFFAYDPSFRGGVSVAAGDVNGDGVVDLIAAPGAGGGSQIKVFSGLGGPVIESYFAYEPAFTGGVTVAAGDVNGDGLADIITGAGIGGGPHVKVFDSSGGVLASFFGLTGDAAGADVAYRVTRTGVPLVVVGGETGGSQVRTYAAPDFAPYNGFDAYEPTFLGGVEVG
jgi:VCBS repeat-containing protein